MPEQPPATSPGSSGVPSSLHAIAQLLRQADHLEPAAQRALAELVDELGNALNPVTVPSAELAHLNDSMAQLVQALHQRQDTGAVHSARDRLEEAIVRAEVKAPVAAGIARRLVDVLANLGI